MRVRGIFLVLLMLLGTPIALAVSSDDGPFTAASGTVRTVETDAAGVYTVEFDVTAGDWRGDRMIVIATFFGESSGELIGQLGLNVNNGKAIMVARTNYANNQPASYDEGYANWGLARGQTAHVRVTIDTANNNIRYEIGGINYQHDLGSGTSSIAAQGLRAELGFEQDATGELGIEEAVPVGWTYRNMAVTGSGALEGTPAPADATQPDGLGVAASDIPWLPNLVEGGGFTPETSDPEGTVRLDDSSFSFTSGGARDVVVPGIDTYERIQVDLDVTISSADPAGFIRQVIDVRNTCSAKRIASVSVRTPAGDRPGQVLIDARGAPKIIVGDVPFTAGTYHLTLVYDLADSEVFVIVAQPDGTVLQTIGGGLNTDGSSVVRSEQTAGGVTLTIASALTDPDQITVAPTGWSFRDLSVVTVPVGEDSGDTGPDGADLETDDGRLAFLTATLADAAREEGGDWTLDCGPVGEVLPLAPSDAPDDAGQRYCVLDIDGDIVFGTFGTGEGESTPEARILESLQDVAYRLQVSDEDIDPDACDTIDTTLAEFQECPDAIDGMRTYAFVDPLTTTSVIIISDSAIDAFSTSVLERIGAFFRSLFGDAGDDESVMAGIPLRRFHHAFLANDQGREIAATWVDREAVLLYRSFVTDLSEWTPQDATYALGLGAQVFTADFEDDNPANVRTWRQLTSGLRIADVSGDAIGGGACGDGVIGLGEQCEPSLEPTTCGDLSNDASDVRPVACGEPGSAPACRLDVASCDFGEGCADDWPPAPRPLPCMTPNVAEDGDDAQCLVDVGGEECREGFCFCSTALFAAVKGRHIDVEFISRFAGGLPSGLFGGGGSENIAVMCRAARYYTNGNDADRQWFEEYFAYQRQHKHMGSEIMSPLYGPPVLAANVAVRDKALSEGHTALADGAGQWLRTTWGLISLGTRDVAMRSVTAQVHGTPKNYPFNDRWQGTTAAVPGSRHLPGAYAWLGFHTLISYAAETSPRTGSAYHWWPDHIFLTLGGTPADWDIGIPDGGTVTLETAGITASERSALHRMITTDQGFSSIAGMVGEAKPVVPITFVRTSEGVMSYFGTWAEGSSDNPTGFNPSGSKAATFAARILNDGSFRTLYPHTESKVGKERGGSWREGQRVCARAEGVTDCMDLPGGQVLMVAEWSAQGLRCVAGSNCGGGDEPPGGDVCGAVVAQQGSYDILGRVEGGVKQIKVVYKRDSPNDRTKEPACYRNGDGGEHVGRITFPDQWIAHAPGTQTVIYTRIKEGGDGHNDLKIVARADATGWTITGSPEGLASPNNVGAGHACWACSGSYCESMNLRVDLSSIPNTVPACEGSSQGGTGGGSCFIAGTPVETPQGAIAIESLRAGDQVTVYDTDTGERRVSAVTETLVHETSTLLLLTLDDETLITTTPEHLFWTKRGWVAAGRLSSTDEVLRTDASWHFVRSAERRETETPMTVYNIHVADDVHDYFAGGVLVHNLKEDELP